MGTFAKLGQATSFPSLELGMEGGRRAGVCDSGYTGIACDLKADEKPEVESVESEVESVESEVEEESMVESAD